MKRTLLTAVATVFAMAAMAQANIDTYVAVNDEPDVNTYALIISNENYKHEVPVPYALNDGAVFQRYLTKTLGIPEKNVKFVPDATLNDMNYNLKWLESVMNVMDGEARAIVYYSGHGMPDDASKKAYLLPVDAYSLEPTSGISTEAFYQRLGAMKSKQTMVFLDACFSGSKREGGMIQAARGIAVKEKKGAVPGNMVVFSATDAGQTAYPLKDKEHGLFTYYILDQLRKKKGCVSLGELSDSVMKNVRRTSFTVNEKEQTPTITASAGSTDWRNWMFASTEAKRFETLGRPMTSPVTTPAQQTSTTTTTTPAAKQQPVRKSFLRH